MIDWVSLKVSPLATIVMSLLLALPAYPDHFTRLSLYLGMLLANKNDSISLLDCMSDENKNSNDSTPRNEEFLLNLNSTQNNTNASDTIKPVFDENSKA